VLKSLDRREAQKWKSKLRRLEVAQLSASYSTVL
jgi:hypothetical protein